MTEVYVEEGIISVIHLNGRNNSLTSQLIIELSDCISELEAKSKVLIITGNEKAFAVGLNIKELLSKTKKQALDEDFLGNKWHKLANCKIPVIAAVSGYVLGGGLELALMCDIIIASNTAKFGQPEINLGLIPGLSATQRLPRIIGFYKTMELCLTGKQISAAEALNIGLINKVVQSEELLIEAKKIAQEIAEKPTTSTKMIKKAIKLSQETSLSEGIISERNLFFSALTTKNKKEGIKAFLEKRKANFS